ncbi:hypothetical protein ABZY06_05150 [Streptomyces sp. NPDC006540]|jgi:hypothetical protein|uniref:hypothetical protein n=1 Tax=Streptomyces sp. NPDC006540 TaxID=3155353 RepID=UPI0033ABBA42
MADAPTDALTDDEVLAAVAEHRGRSGDTEWQRLANSARIEHQPLLDCTVTRCIESRTTGEQTRPAPFDLSGRPVVDDLDAYRQDPPKNPRRRETVHLVLDGSVREVPCHDCSNGKQQCPNCKGTGRLQCEPQVPCTDCKSVTSCTKCRGRGGSRKAPVTPVAPQKVKRPGVRVDCALCEASGTACPRCLGWGKTLCTDCGGDGKVKCRHCQGRGRWSCDTCTGKGRLTVWRGATITRAPEDQDVTPPPPRAPWIIRSRLKGRGAWRETVVGAKDRLPEDLAAHHRSAIERSLVKKKGEVTRQVSIRHLPLARVVLAEEQDRVYYVYAGVARPQVTWIPSRRWVSRVAAGAAAAMTTAVLLFVALR